MTERHAKLVVVLVIVLVAILACSPPAFAAMSARLIHEGASPAMLAAPTPTGEAVGPVLSYQAPAPAPVQLETFLASHYWPDAPPKPGAPYPGWPNCGSPLVNGHCTSRMGGSALEWDEYVKVAIACPMTDNYPTWTTIRIVEPAEIAGLYVCLDHGSAIVETPEGDWLDFLWPLETWTLQHGQPIYGYVENRP